MPDLNQEMEHLAEAEDHIADGEKLIARLKQQIDRAIEQGGDTTQAEKSLDAMRTTLTVFLTHRDAIVRTIEDIRSGKYSSAPK